jgi:hypothetical protein
MNLMYDSLALFSSKNALFLSISIYLSWLRQEREGKWHRKCEFFKKSWFSSSYFFVGLRKSTLFNLQGDGRSDERLILKGIKITNTFQSIMTWNYIFGVINYNN